MKAWIYLLTLTSLSQLAGCSEPTLPSGIVYCSEGNPESFNPQLVTSGTTIDATAHQVYNRLIQFDTDANRLFSSLATDWKMSKDGLSYHFTLRKNVAFHDSERFIPSRFFNADDVIFSFKRIIDPTHPYHDISRTGYPFFQSINFANLVRDIERVNDHEVVFHLNQKDASFLFNLATGFAVILSQEYAEQLLAQGTPEDIDFFAIGTGPFKLTEYVKNDYIRYKRHDSFWGPFVENEQLVFDITPNTTARLTKLITGDCAVSALPRSAELTVLDKLDDIIIDSNPGLNVAFWAFNTQKPPLNDLRVRQALAHAIDKRNILDVVYNNAAVEATGILPPSSWAYSKNFVANEYNPLKAKLLLEQANVTDLSLNVWAMPVARAYNPNALKMAELIQADLAQIGVKLNIVSYDWSVFTQKLAAAEYDSVLIGWNADNSDPDNFFTPILSCNALISNNNRSRWCNYGFDHILDEARSLTTQESRKVYFQSAEAIVSDQVPVVPIAHAEKIVLKHKSATSVQVNPYGGISFANPIHATQEDKQ